METSTKGEFHGIQLCVCVNRKERMFEYCTILRDGNCVSIFIAEVEMCSKKF